MFRLLIWIDPGRDEPVYAGVGSEVFVYQVLKSFLKSAAIKKSGEVVMTTFVTDFTA